MKRHYTFNYNMNEAEACFVVNTEIFTAEMALATLEFFSWDWDEEADPIDEVMKKYAMQCIKHSTFNGHNVFGVKGDMEKTEGFGRVDGSIGITLNMVSGYEFYDEDLSMEIITDKES